MDVEIVFAGLCSFLNPGGKNSTMGDPAVIAVQTPHGNGTEHHHEEHIAFIGFDSRKVEIDDDSPFEPHPDAPEFYYMPLDGVEISIVGHAAATPIIDSTFSRLIVRKDNYWPEAKDQWNRDYVPSAGYKPKKTAVKVYMRLGSGTLGAGRVSMVRWEFPRPGLSSYGGYFAEEAVYHFQVGSSEVVVKLTDLESGTPAGTFRFSPAQGWQGSVELFVANNLKGDMPGTFERRVTTASKQGDHFKFLNRVADAGLGNGPIPITIGSFDPDVGGGETSGPCGPVSGNN